MMDKRERVGLIRALASTVKDHVAASIVDVRKYVADELMGLSLRLDALDKAVKDIPAGLPGKDGEKGQTGERGEPGPQGEMGLQGEPGPAGERGETGEPGRTPDVEAIVGRVFERFPMDSVKRSIFEAIPTPKDGAVGPQGLKGEPGESGKPGERGEQGLMGPQGLKGDPGPSGERGLPGEPGNHGEPGAQGERGERGIDGRDGRDGKDGIAGRDALDLEILSAIDPDKSYPRGTFAQDDGGLKRAIRNTKGSEDAWEVVVRGVSDAEIVRGEDPREVTVRLSLTGGLIKETKWRIPMQIYRGVYKESTEYFQGDTVTWGGSQWHCNVDGAKSAPGNNPAEWTLSTQRGRPGKDGENGKDYTPPKPIKA